MLKLLIDECLHTSLLVVAHRAGHACGHVNFLGLGGAKDWELMSKIRAEEYTFVTNNRTDFAACYRLPNPNVPPARQRELFQIALLHIGDRDLTNTVLEVDIQANAVVCREYEYPGP